MEIDRINVARTEEEDLEILRDRIIECICQGLLSKNLTTFHGVEMVKRCARGFLDERGIDQYQFSGEHEYYNHILERVYRPLVDQGVINEYENNNYKISSSSRLHEICRIELSQKSYIKWNDFWRSAKVE